ncbi:MAG TPA: hypothetical protein VHX39_25875, partial [Acetobacteraceae bacterium]|nr:hypothetical protein [Acetobacteraceae bacterium]
MVQTTFSVGNAGSLTTVLQEISGGGADAAINTAYTIAMTAGVSLSAGVNLEAGSSLLLEGSFPFIVPGFTATGTVVTDLNLTGTVILDNGLLDNPELVIVSGTTVAGLFSGTVLGTSGDAGDSANNNGIIQSGGPYAAVEFNSGNVLNGWNGSPSALIAGVPAGVDLVISGLVQNGGTIIGTGPDSVAVSMGAGTVDNGQIGEALALLSGGMNGVVIQGAGVVNNDGLIFGAVSDAVYIGSGTVTNGQIGGASALIDGGPSGNGVGVASGLGTVANFSTIIGGGAAGVYLKAGGTVTNGAASDSAAVISGAAEGVLLLHATGLLQNYGTVLGDGSDAAQSVVGAFFYSGGTIENVTNMALIGGLEWGALVEFGAGFVSNAGTIDATAALGFGVDLTAGGTVVNMAGATISGPYDGVRVSAGVAGSGAVVMNDGTILGSVGVDFQSGATE